MPTPASVVAGQWQGGQVRNEDDLADFVSSVPVQALAGWGRILMVASIDDVPGLIRDRSWLGPVLLVVLAALLWLGGRLGYPYFRPMVEGGRRWGPGAAPATAGTRPVPSAVEAPPEISVRVSGHALTTSGQRRHLDQARAVIRPSVIGEDGRMTAALDLADGSRVALAAYDTGVLGRVERGEVVSLAGVQPALWAHWYGTDLRMTFSTAADRDHAAEARRRPAAHRYDHRRELRTGYGTVVAAGPRPDARRDARHPRRERVRGHRPPRQPAQHPRVAGRWRPIR